MGQCQQVPAQPRGQCRFSVQRSKGASLPGWVPHFLRNQWQMVGVHPRKRCGQPRPSSREERQSREGEPRSCPGLGRGGSGAQLLRRPGQPCTRVFDQSELRSARVIISVSTAAVNSEMGSENRVSGTRGSSFPASHACRDRRSHLVAEGG